jgi:hypothetical protein
MNAVNLIPSDARRRRGNVSTSPATLGLIGGLLLVLVAAVLYATAANQVTSRQDELARVTANANSWKAAADSYQSYVGAAQTRAAELADVKSLATQRYQWQVLLSQIATQMPADSELSSLNATATAAAASTPAPSTSTAAPAAPAAPAASTAPVPSLQISGCAVSQSAVAQTMVQLHRIPGVSAVSLSSSSDSGGAGAASGGCTFPVQYQLSLTFNAPSATSTASTVASTQTTSTTASATPASSTATTAGAAQ